MDASGVLLPCLPLQLGAPSSPLTCPEPTSPGDNQGWNQPFQQHILSPRDKDDRSVAAISDNVALYYIRLFRRGANGAYQKNPGREARVNANLKH